LAGLNFKKVFYDMGYFQAGMFSAKWAAKRFGGGASETDNASWTWRSYIQGGLGATVAAFLMQAIKKGGGQKVLEGGLNLMLYEMIQRELIPGSEWATGQFGQYYDGVEDYGYQPGEIETDDSGRTYMLGEDNQWRELPEVSGMGEALVPVGPLGSEALVPVGPLGADDAYAKAFFRA
jgi:hypothetical protein